MARREEEGRTGKDGWLGWTGWEGKAHSFLHLKLCGCVFVYHASIGGHTLAQESGLQPMRLPVDNYVVMGHQQFWGPVTICDHGRSSKYCAYGSDHGLSVYCDIKFVCVYTQKFDSNTQGSAKCTFYATYKTLLHRLDVLQIWSRGGNVTPWTVPPRKRSPQDCSGS